jgi:putative ABC transport system permease protein
LRNILIGLQVAVSLVLLIGAGLLARGSERAFGIDLGFDYRRMISVEVHAAAVKHDASRMVAIRRQLLLRFEGLPGVRSVSVASRAPLTGGNRTLSIGLEGHPPNSEHAPEAFDNLVTRDYFETVGVSILHGRNFTEQEMRDSPDFDGVPVIVSAATAQKFWPGQNAIGKRISFAHPTGAFEWAGEVHPQSRSSVVIGVAKDIRSLFLERLDETCIYLPVSRTFDGSIVIRTEGDPKRVVAALRNELQAVDSNLEAFILDFRSTFSQQPAFVLSRIGAIGSTIIGILGLLLAAVGIYGMVSFAVSQRTHEIGVRVALGALRSDVVGLVLRQSMRPVMIGVAFGLAGAVGVSHLLIAFLFGLSTVDPVTFLGVSAFLMTVAVLAGYVPARRAAKVDPMVALRYE